MKLATIAVVGILTLSPSLAYAACSATYPVGSTADSVVSFLASGTNLPFVGPTTFQAAEAGTLTYDSATNTLQLCDGTAWRAVTTSNSPIAADSLDFTEFKDAMTLDASTVIAASGTNVLSLTNTGTGNSFLVNDAASDATPFVIDAAGNVGIGTTTPRSLLHVVPAGANSYALFQSIGVGGTAFTSTDTIPITSSNGVIGYNGLALIPSKWGNATTVDSHSMMYIGGAQRNNSAVAGSLAFGNWGYFTGTGTSAGGLGNATAQSDAVSFKFVHYDAGSQFAQRLELISRSATGTETNALSVLSNGNVGIGTVSPQSALHVGKTSNYAQIKIGDDSASSSAGLNGWSALAWTDGNNYMDSKTQVNGYTHFRTGQGTETGYVRNFMSVQASTGNVGIGTTTPGAKLEVAGGTTGANTGILILKNTGGTAANSGAAIQFYNSDNVPTQVEQARIGALLQGGTAGASASDLAFSTTSAGALGERMRITSGGNVGIGTPNPTAGMKLDVLGHAYVQGDLYAKRLFDQDNSSYYVDPNSAGTSANLAGNANVGGALTVDGGSSTLGNGASAFTILTLNSKAASGVTQNPYIAWHRDATRQAYMGWGTPGTTFHLNMENGNQLYVTNTWGAVFSNDDVRKPSGGSFVASSDARLKDIKGDYTKGLTDIEKLNPVRYNYKAGNPRKEPSVKEFVGLIAQDVQEIFPDAVNKDRDGYLSLDPSQLTYALINAVQELKAANDNLAVKVEQQANEFEAYKAAHP